MLTLYGHPFSRASRCLWMLRELGVAFEHVPTGFQDGGTRDPAFLALNPNGRVPVLVHDGLVLFESLAINLHLARAFGGEIAPRDPAEEALATQWSFWVVGEIDKPLLLAAANSLLFPEARRSAEERSVALGKLDRPFRVLDAALARREHLVGGRFTVADLNVASVMTLVLLADLPLAAYPHLAGWLATALDRPAAAGWRDIRFTIPRPPSASAMLGMFV